jgi:leucyl aminopeptidase
MTFAEYDVPSTGTIALAVQQNAWEDGAFADVNELTNGALRRAVDAMQFKAESNQQLDLPGLAPFDRVILVGMGSENLTARNFEDAGGLIGQLGADSSAQRIDILWAGDENQAGTQLAFGTSLGQYRFLKYRQREPATPPTGEGEFVVRTPRGPAGDSIYRSQWEPVIRAVKFARDVISEPGNEIYPESFVERARQAFDGVADVRIDVLDVAAMERLGMGGILAVGRGSIRPPRLLVVRYSGGDRNDAPLAFVGKGITFDSGGISIKGSDGMWRMKSDMSGAAAVTGAVLALAGRSAPVNAIAVAALAENMPSGNSGRPGDVVRTLSGKTFEVISTDAEGRMVLSDAVWYAQQEFNPSLVIDLATLTGAVRTALGDEYAGLFSRHDLLAQQLAAAGELSGEHLWRLPLHASYARDLESPVADLRNSAGSEAGAGAGVGAYFIGAWVDENMPWAHLDIAGMAWRESEGLPTSPPGASGFGVRLLDRFVRANYE